MSVSVETALLRIDQLSPHPDNPRRFYRPEEIEALATSIREMGGVEQALIVVPDGALPDNRPHFLVVDGNYRLAAALMLGKKAPRLKCEIRRDSSRRDVLLVMARTSVLWFAKDPISEARHYRKLIDEEKLTRLELVRKLGHSQNYLAGRLRLLDLDPEIQDLVAEARLTKDPRIVDALLSIGDPGPRIALARELAKRGATLKACLAACERVRAHLAITNKDRRLQAARKNGRPNAVFLAEEEIGAQLAGEPAPAREAARAVCQACEVRAKSLPQVSEPAWSLITHAAGDVCGNCPVAHIRSACDGCPLPQMLVRLVGHPTPPSTVQGGVRHPARTGIPDAG